MIFFETLFYVSLGILLYVNLGYFLLLTLISRLSKIKKSPRNDTYRPTVTVLIPVYNEEAIVSEKIKNALAQDYPKDKIQILVGSDDSSDRTNEIVNGFAENGVILRIIRPRMGKTNVLNNLVESATGEILIFTDANVFFKNDAVSCLVRPFEDVKVGSVCGQVIPLKSEGTSIGFGSGLYWRMEEKLKEYESALGSTTGATGGIFAMRRGLYRNYPVTMLPDMVPSLDVLRRGYKILVASDALAYEKMAGRAEEEFNRKRRIASRSILGLVYLKELLNPFKFPVVVFQIVSHKILRWAGLLFILAAFLSNLILLLGSGKIWIFWIICQGLFYMCAFSGFLLDKKKIRIRIFATAYYYLVANLGAFLGVLDFFRGKVPVIWNSAESSRSKVGPTSYGS